MMSTIVQLDMSWWDEFLKWDNNAYGDQKTIMVRQKNIWFPDIVVANSVSAYEKIG